MTKQPHTKLSELYLSALSGYIGAGRGPAPIAGSKVGAEAISVGCNTIDLARIHQKALIRIAAAQKFTADRKRVIKRAGLFFAGALAPLERWHEATRQSLRESMEIATSHSKHRKILAEQNRQLQHEIRRRKAGQSTIRRAKERYRRLFTQSVAMQEELRLLARKVLAVQEEERREISRELHDEVVQTLVGVNVELSALATSAEVNTRALRTRIKRTQRLVGNSVDVVHAFARQLRPAVLDDLGLIPALHVFIRHLAAKSSLKIHLKTFTGIEQLTGARRTTLFRVAQESLTNVARHSGASVASLTISKTRAGIIMRIHDNGKSFEVARALSPRTNKRLGLIGMRERLEMVGGGLTITSTPKEGTTVIARLPSIH